MTRRHACYILRHIHLDPQGIALRVDPDYAIVAECFPYLARRLLNDDSPRMRAVLKDILYGNRTRMDVERLLRVADGLAAYTTEGLAEQGGAAAAAVAAAVAAAGQQQLRRGPAAAALPAATADKEVRLGRLSAVSVAGDRVHGPCGRMPAPYHTHTCMCSHHSHRFPTHSISHAAIPRSCCLPACRALSLQVLSPVVVDTLRSVLRPGSYVSELMVEELVSWCWWGQEEGGSAGLCERQQRRRSEEHVCPVPRHACVSIAMLQHPMQVGPPGSVTQLG